MATDLRYMKLGRGPGSTWFFVYNIPTDLRGHPRFITSRGKPMTKITESLETTDPEKAREIRNQRIVYWDRQFRMMREGPSEDDIREEAVEVYRAALKAQKELEAEIGWDGSGEGEWLIDGEMVPYSRAVDWAIEQQAEDEIADYCRRTGAVLVPNTEPYRKVGIAFIKAQIAAGHWDAWLPLPDGRELRGVDHGPHLPPLPKIEPPIPVVEPKPIAAPPLPQKAAETFSEAFERYLATELDGTSADTIADYRRKVKLFTDKVGDLPLGKITDHMAVAFLDDFLLGERKQKPRTRNTYAMLLSAVFKCAIRRKKATTNPFADQRIKAEAVHYKPFTDQELAKLFAGLNFEIAPDKHKTATALPWASLIAAYTGARREEVAQLKASDIKKTDGIWYFEFCEDGNGKTKAATRTVPLHHALIDAGLLRYRDKLPKGSLLFPGLRDRTGRGLGKNLGDCFSWWRKKLGLEGVNFHSFRHTVGDRLRKAGIQESDIAAVLGHEDKRITSRVYGHDGPGLKRLKEIVERLDYAGLLSGRRRRRS
jgi:integrase